MTADTPLARARENVTGIVSILVTGIWMSAMFTGQEWWLAALLVGYIVVVPLTAMLFGDEDDWEEYVDEDEFQMPTDSDDEDHEESALESLRRRYAEGELTDEQFERKLDRLLETETLEDVEEYRERANAERERELE